MIEIYRNNKISFSNIYIIMKERFNRVKYSILSNASKLIGIYKYYLLVFFIVFLICFITGIMTCVHYASDISCENLINTYLLSYLKKNSSYLTFFLMQGLFYLLISLWFIIFTRNIFFEIVNYVIIIFSSYIFGFDVCIIIITLGLSGVVFGVLIYGVLGILTIFTLLFILSIACKRIRDRKKMCQTHEYSDYKKLYLIFVFLGLLILFVLSILFGIIHIFVIVD